MQIETTRLFATIGALKVENDMLREQNAALRTELQVAQDKQNAVSTERPDAVPETLEPTDKPPARQ